MEKIQYGDIFSTYKKFHGVHIPYGIINANIPDSSKILLGRLFAFAGKDGYCFPTRKTLMKELNWKLSKLDRNIQILKEKKLIKTVQKDYNSPSNYYFLWHHFYEKNNSAPTPKNNSAPTPKNNSAPTPKNNRQKRYNNKEIHKEIFSKEKIANKFADEKENNFCNNVSCEKTLVNDSCKNDPLNIFGYSTATIKILKIWNSFGGKIHKRPNAKAPVKINNMITELLIDGNNPYSRVIEDTILINKQWTVQEVISCIKYYSKVLKKDISKLYFDQFVLYTNTSYGKNKRRVQPDYSPLIDVFGLVGDSLVTDELTIKRAKRLKKELDPNNEIPKITFIKAAKIIKSIEKDYCLQPGRMVRIYHNSMVNAYIGYINENNNDRNRNVVKYIGSENFKKDFIKEYKKQRVIEVKP